MRPLDRQRLAALERLGRRVGPLPPLFGAGARLLGVLRPSGCLGLLRLTLELLCARTELVRPGFRFWIDAAGGSVTHLLLDGPQPAFQLGAPLARHLADRVPFFADRP